MCVPFARPYCSLILPFLACYFENLDSLVQPDVSNSVVSYCLVFYLRSIVFAELSHAAGICALDHLT